MRLDWRRSLIITIVLAAIALAPVVASAFVGTPDPLSATAGVDPVIAHLEWGASEGAVRYVVSVATAQDGPFNAVDEVEGTSYDYTEGVGGIPYYFRVDAIDANGERSEPAAEPAGPVAASWASNPHVTASTTSNKCSICHVPHSAAAAPIMRANEGTQTAGQAATCLVCHDGDVVDVPDVTASARDSFALASGHAMDTPEATGGLTTNCASCHDGHAVASESPMVPLERINGSVVSGTGNGWCLACHDDSDENTWYEGTYPALSDPLRDAAGYPVAGTWSGAETYTGSTNPHRLIPETTQTAAASGTQVRRGQGDCLYCHAAHRGPNTYDGLVGTFRPTTAGTLASDQVNGEYAEACFACHGGSVPSGFTTAPADIKQYATSASPTSTAGHRIKTPGGTLPVGAPLPCYECHNPHGSARGNGKLISDARGANLLVSETPTAVRRFCFTCHTASDTGRGWDSTSSAFASVGTQTIVGIPRSGGALRLPMMYQHEEAGNASCDDCHGWSELSPDNNVHNPRDPLASHTSSSASVDTVGGTVTDYHAASMSYEYECTQCHSADLTMEHFKSSTATPTLSGYASVCLGCHHTKVDGFTSSWNGSCAGNGNACHPTKHTGMATIHDASTQVMSSPGTESQWTTSAVTLVNEGWESGTYTTNGWTYAPIVASGAHTGTYTARLAPQAFTAVTAKFMKEFDTSNLDNPTVEFWSNTSGFLAGDKLQVYYTTTGWVGMNPNVPWIPLYTPASGTQETTWTKHTYSLPKAKSVILLFTFAYVSNASTTRYCYYDDIKVSGVTPPAWTATAVPAGSTATRSCGSGYLNGATNCHDVSDLADIHSKATTTTAGVTYTGCRVCHRDNSAVPASANCQTASCHPGVNGETHSSEYHDSGFASNAVGAFAGTGFETAWCTGCHFNGIAEEHRRLNAFATTGCAMCHKKSSDTGAPLSVSAADTSATIHADVAPDDSLCTDCHKTVTAAKPHVQSGSLPQFDSTYSGHKVYSTLRGAVTAGTIGSTAITLWSLPVDNLWLKSVAVNGQPAAQLTSTSMVVCSDCHGSIAGATGPHGGAMVANYAINESTGMPYDNSYTSGALYLGTPAPDYLPAMSNSTSICSKCHVSLLNYNNVHGAMQHTGTTDGKCINCHTPIPHAWKRPRLIGYTTDPAPYATLKVSALRVRATEEPTGWGIGDCSACSVHSAGASVWP